VTARPGADGTLVSGPDEPTGGAGAAGDGTVGARVEAGTGAGDGSAGVAATAATGDRPHGDDGAGAAQGGGGDRHEQGDRWRGMATVAAITAVLAVPVVIATIAVRSPHWYPLIDLAQIEMRVRDVGTSHPPLVGLGGRIFGLDTQGSHPGPLSFYLLAPVYRMLGSSSWALQASAAALDVGAIAAAVWAAQRRWGLRGALLIAAGLALAMRIWGTTVLVYPWNPYMPVLFWVLFLVCVWAVLCDDLVLLPVAVVAGSLCAQTHIPYLGMVGGLVAVMAVSLALAYRRAGEPGATPSRRSIVRWSAVGAALGALIWLPVFVDELGGDPGNISIIVDSFRHAEDPVLGLGPAWDLLVEHLSPLRLVRGDRVSVPVAHWPGLALLAAWVASVVAAVRLRDRTLLRLHVVVGTALVLGLVSVSRILGVAWFYLTLWAFGTAALVLVAVVATAAAVGAAVLARRGDDQRPASLAWLPIVALGVAVLWPTLALARRAPDTEDADARVSDDLGQVVQPTVDAIDDGTVEGGPDGTFMLTWVDPVNLGGQGMGLLLELERRGYDAGAPTPLRLAVRDHRVVTAAEADAEIHVATGVPANTVAAERPGSRRIAYHDPRNATQRAEYDTLRADIVDRLEADGLDDLVPLVDENFIMLASDERAPEDVKRALYIMGRMPQPLGVYTWTTP
jgi:hypothetical protein